MNDKDLLELVTEIGEDQPDGLIPEDLDGMLYDHPVRFDDCGEVPVIRFH